MTCRGFVKRPLAVQEWEKYAHALPSVQVSPFMVLLFTDGSTMCSDTAARSAWSVVLGDPATVECAMVNTGVVPGKQSNYRAEICAVLDGIQCADEGHIYVDLDVLGCHPSGHGHKVPDVVMCLDVPRFDRGVTRGSFVRRIFNLPFFFLGGWRTTWPRRRLQARLPPACPCQRRQDGHRGCRPPVAVGPFSWSDDSA